MPDLLLTKHHACGNDFLILMDLENRQPMSADLARFVCDRHRGAGADSLIRVAPGTGGTDVTMDYWNGDGSYAEMTGNGIRCMAQAIVMAKALDGQSDLTVMTGGGIRKVVVGPNDEVGNAWITVDMGPATVQHHGRVKLDALDGEAVLVRVGNPHLVVSTDDPDKIDLQKVGPLLETSIKDGANVEFVNFQTRPPTMRVWERGCGETQACGSGTTAVAAAGKFWGRVASEVTVRQPGGDLRIDITSDDTFVLSGPVNYICSVEIPCP